MSWLVLTLASAVSAAVTKILQKVLLTDTKSDPFAFAFVFQLMVAGIFLIYTVVTGTLEPLPLSEVWVNFVAMTVLYSLGNVALFKAFKEAEASEVTIIFVSSTLWSVVSAVILLGERLTSVNGVGIGLILAGVATVNYTRSRWQLNRGHVLALAAAVLYGVAFTNDAYILNQYRSVAAYMVPAFFLPGIVSLVYSPKSVRRLPYFGQMKVLRNLIVCALFYAASALTIFTAYKMGGKAAVISPIQQTSVVFTVVLGYWWLKERERLWKKIVGTVLVFAGVVLLV